MAPRKLTQIERWIGTEAERLALDASGFSPGSTFFERDTGSMHKWDGTSWGKEIITVADIAGIKTAIESLDNKELATELTLAQILTILGGTAADIGTLKLENGQIKGYDGTDWQPVRVNDAGELILASEVTVNAEGLSVDLGKLVLQAKNPSGVPVDMKSDTEGNLKVSLSGATMSPVDLQDHLIPDDNPIPVKEIPSYESIILVDEFELRADNTHYINPVPNDFILRHRYIDFRITHNLKDAEGANVVMRFGFSSGTVSAKDGKLYMTDANVARPHWPLEFASNTLLSQVYAGKDLVDNAPFRLWKHTYIMYYRATTIPASGFITIELVGTN